MDAFSSSLVFRRGFWLFLVLPSGFFEGFFEGFFFRRIFFCCSWGENLRFFLMFGLT